MKVSAIVPVFNSEKFLTIALDSVIRQTYPVHELIVVDDGSKDDSAKIASGLGATVIRLPCNMGAAVARNAGLRRADGDLVAWLDADDYWAPHHVATLTKLFERYPHSAAAFGAVQRFGASTEVIRGYVRSGEPRNVFWQAFRHWLHQTSGSMVRRDVLLAIGGFSIAERLSEDFDLWMRLSRNNLCVACDEVTSYWRSHPRQQSRSYMAQVAAVYRFRWKYWDAECESGIEQVAQVMATTMFELWKSDIAAAMRRGDLAMAEAIKDLHQWVPPCRDKEAQLALELIAMVERYSGQPRSSRLFSTGRGGGPPTGSQAMPVTANQRERPVVACD